jgi:hypothetical protein
MLAHKLIRKRLCSVSVIAQIFFFLTRRKMEKIKNLFVVILTKIARMGLKEAYCKNTIRFSHVYLQHINAYHPCRILFIVQTF